LELWTGRAFAWVDEMKASKLLAILAFAGFCGTSETQARSHKFEIKHLEKQRAERVEAHREAKERFNELNRQINFKAAETKGRMRPAPFEAVETEDDAPDISKTKPLAHENWAGSEHELPNFNWNVINPDLIRERELEEARMRATAREIAQIDKAIRKGR
jgi:hypothetical protein